MSQSPLAFATTLESIPPTRPSISGVHAVHVCNCDDGPHDPSRCPEARIGLTIEERYELTGVLGVGGMGTVYRAHDRQLGTDVAVKILHPQFARNAEAVARFEREAEQAFELDHPGVVRIHAFGTSEATGVYMVMELLDGISIDEVVESGPLPAEQAVRLAAQALDALAHAHDHGVIHRDVKPSNLFLAGDEIKLVDFGIAKVMEDESDLTRSGIAMGTPRYMSPEQLVDAKRATGTADVYSMGATLFEMLTGQSPASAHNQAALIIQVATGDIRRRADDLVPTIPRAIADVIERSLAFEPSKRPASPRAMRDALLGALTAETEETSRPLASIAKSARQRVERARGWWRRQELAFGPRVSPHRALAAGAAVSALVTLVALGATAVTSASPEPALLAITPTKTLESPRADVITFAGSSAMREPTLSAVVVSAPETNPTTTASPAPNRTAPVRTPARRAPRATDPTPPRATPTQPSTPTRAQMNQAYGRMQGAVAQCTDGDLNMRFEALISGDTGRVIDSVVRAPGVSQTELACLYRAVATYRVPPFEAGVHRVYGSVTITPPTE